MSIGVRCECRSCTIRRLLGPTVVITVGLLFLLQEMRGGHFAFDNTYPVILLVIGAILLGCALAPRDGHISGSAPSATPPGTPGAPTATPQNPFQGQGQ